MIHYYPSTVQSIQYAHDLKKLMQNALLHSLLMPLKLGRTEDTSVIRESEAEISDSDTDQPVKRLAYTTNMCETISNMQPKHKLKNNE